MRMFFTRKTKSFKKKFEEVMEFALSQFDDIKFMMLKYMFTNLIVRETTGESDARLVFQGKNGYFLEVDINLKDSPKYIGLKFAHEVGHLIVMSITSNRYNSFNRSDTSFAITTLTRKGEGKTYGIVFEEMFCNWFAVNAVNNVYGELEDVSEFVSKSWYITEHLINAFSIAHYDKWDEAFDGNNEPKNMFLYGICNCDISYAIYEFDKALGKGSWRNLMKRTYDYSLDDETEAMVTVKAYEDILRDLRNFKSINCQKLLIKPAS